MNAGVKRSWRRCIVEFWTLMVRPFLQDPEQKGALLRPLLVFGMTIGGTGLSVWMTLWQRSFYDALEAKQHQTFLELIGMFSLLAAVMITVAILRLKVTRDLCMQWRAWATDRMTADWLKDRRFYHLELLREQTDNPDQRLSEDLRLCTIQSLELMLGIFSNGLGLVSFLSMLWAVSGALEFSLGGIELSIPGYMVWVAVAYACVGSWGAHLVGRPLNTLNFKVEKGEADYRAGLFRIREHAESIALYRGEQSERSHLQGRFGVIRDLWNEMTKRKLQLLAFGTGYGQIAVIFPILIAAPQYFLTAMTLGVLMQITSAFHKVNDCLSWFVDNYADLSAWRASVERLLDFSEALKEPHRGRTALQLQRQPSQTGDLRATPEFSLSLPCGAPLLLAPGLWMDHGSRVLLSGPSGCGKSTLLRAMAGLWPYGTGEIYHPEDNVLFLPQRPYLPSGTLRACLAFPSAPDSFTDEELRSALERSNLSALASQLEEDCNWVLVLSGGEQQRLAFARAFLQRPRWLFMDESTSALDEETERLLFTRLHAELPDCSILTVAHRPYLADYHHATWRVTPTEGAARLWTESLAT